uniref:Chemokine interleukin-8-like domain-containing protein n=1 Tax=Monopterus albus TaxID=43700 RepID=A0A3Q3R0F7_MONAL|nr:C-C motif chemokine 5-like [Monopterus albus]
MKLQVLVFLLFLTCTSLSMAQGTYGNCCLGHVERLGQRARKNIQSYRMQETDGDCNITAVVFVMKKKPSQKKQRHICGNPEHQWVRDVIVSLDKKMQN